MIYWDEQGYLLTGRDVSIDPVAANNWPLSRDPFLLETSVPGVFAAGDVWHGSIKRMAAGVGEAVCRSPSSTSTWLTKGEFGTPP